MEINYETIINHLVKGGNKKNSCNKKHILSYSDTFPEKFSNIFQNKFYKYGITINDKNNNNISFYSSILTLLNKNYICFSFDEELEYIEKFKKYLQDTSKTFKLSVYLNKYLETNKLICKELTINDDIYYFQYIVEILDINILILNFNTVTYQIIYPDIECNPWKPTLILFNYCDFWEPILFDINSKRTFCYNDNIIKKVLTECNVSYYKDDLIKKKFKLNDNIQEIVNEITTDSNIIVEKIEKSELIKKSELIIENIQCEETFIKSSINTYDIITLNKMIKTELINICKIHNLKITTKLLKKDLIDIIIKNNIQSN